LGKKHIVITTDFINARPIAQELGIGTPFDIGRILVAANLSDLCGSGAKPESFLLGTMFHRQTSWKQYKEFMRGVKFELDKYSIPLIGGDTKLGDSNAFLGVAIGSVDDRKSLLLRSGAKSNQEIWVSGYLGSISAAILIGKFFKRDSALNKWSKKVILEPEVPLIKSRKVAKKKIEGGGTDISDGLAADLRGLCKSSGVGAIIFANQIPLAKEVKLLAYKMNVPPWFFPITIGGEFQFILTANKKYGLFLKANGFTKIGITTKAKVLQLSYNDSITSMPMFGHNDSRNLTFEDEVLFFFEKLHKLFPK
jgi:thiamine-monophosphate kinase